LILKRAIFVARLVITEIEFETLVIYYFRLKRIKPVYAELIKVFLDSW